MIRGLTAADRTLQGYASQHGYEATFEPSWQAEYGEPFATNPDSLLARDGARAVVEVRGFTTRALTDFLSKYRPRGGAVPPQLLRKPLYYGIKEKAEQLEPFAGTGAALVIALANPGGADVDLGEHEMTAALFGEVSIQMPINEDGEGDLSESRHVAEAGYGVFRGTDWGGMPTNRWPHVSGVAVLGAFDRYAAFQDTDLAAYVEARNPETRLERMTAAVEWANTPVGRREAPGPEGFDYRVTYYDLAGYCLGCGPGVPDSWFSGPEDQRLGFDATGENFGPTQPPDGPRRGGVGRCV